MVLIFQTIIGTAANLNSEKIGKSFSQLIYETSPTIDTSAESNEKGGVVTFVRAARWIQSVSGFPVKQN